MKDRAFHEVVVLEPRIGRYRYVRSVKEAGRVLLHEWPIEPSDKHKAAMKAVLEALKGEKPVSFARLALIAAAEEARLLADPSVLPQTVPASEAPPPKLAAE